MVTPSPGKLDGRMDDWLAPAFAYIPQWLEYQMRESEQPGCVLALVHDGRVVFERGFGHADIVSRVPLTPRNRFRVASHSKSSSAAGILNFGKSANSPSTTASDSMSEVFTRRSPRRRL